MSQDATSCSSDVSFRLQNMIRRKGTAKNDRLERIYLLNDASSLLRMAMISETGKAQVYN